MLDYESFNFIENLGSISLFLVIYLAWIIISIVLKFGRVNLRSDWLTSKVGQIYITQSLFRFFLETYFELLISSVLFIGMLRTIVIWNAADLISVVIQVIFLALCIGFALFLIWFTIFGVKKLTLDKAEKFKRWYEWIGKRLEEKAREREKS